jgi:hypothetical protein
VGDLCYELDRYNQTAIWLCSELCHSRQQLAFYRAHILPARTDLCVVIQTYEPTPSGKGILLLRNNWMAQPFSELSGCRFITRWFPHGHCSNYCQRNLLQQRQGATDVRILPTDAVLNIVLMDSYHATSKMVVLPGHVMCGSAMVYLG